MSKFFLFVTSAFVTMSGATSAFAHLGHVGEVAGHGHLIAIGATLAAGALAAAIGLAARKKAKEEAQRENDEMDAEEEAADPA